MTSSVDVVQQSMKNVSVADKLLPVYPRPGYGKKGSEVDLLVNFFPLNFPRPLKLYQYTVEIIEANNRNQNDPGTPIKNVEVVRHAFWTSFRAFSAQFGAAVCFDDHNTCWTGNKLPLTPPHFTFYHRMDHIDEKKKGKFDIHVKLYTSILGEFVVDSNSAEEDVASSSNRALKAILTQRARYCPGSTEVREREFSRKWTKADGAIFAIPYLMRAPRVEVKVCPGVRAWLGLYARIRTIQNLDHVVNFSLVNKLFYELDMNLIDFYFEVVFDKMLCTAEMEREWRKNLPNYGMNGAQRELAARKLSDLRVKAGGSKDGRQRPGAIVYEKRGAKRNPELFLANKERHFTVTGFHTGGACSFFLPDGQTMEEFYYRNGFPLRFPNLPLVTVKQGKIPPPPQPMEVLFTSDTITKYTKVLDLFTKRKYIQEVSRTPTVYNQLTHRMMESLQVAQEDQFTTPFGISVNSQMMSCKGRLLDAPIVRNKDSKPVALLPDRRFRVKKLIDVPKEVVFSVIAMCSPDTGEIPIGKDKIEYFVNELKSCAEERGVPVRMERQGRWIWPAQAYSVDKGLCLDERDLEVSYNAQRRLSFCMVPNTPTISLAVDIAMTTFKKDYKEDENSHCILIVTDTMYDLYGRIKSVCDRQLEAVCQVVDHRTVTKAVDQEIMTIYYNLVLKINAKLGGVNILVDDPMQPSLPVPPEVEPEVEPEMEPETKNSVPPRAKGVMYIGIDVTHPSPNSGIDVSIASMVASTDMGTTKYESEIYVQMRAKETVECFDHQFQQLMFRYNEMNGHYPAHVVIYRDGVSDSELLRTASLELQCIKEVWRNISSEDPDAQPTFTYIVVQKRHGTRFFVPTNEKDGEGRDVLRNPKSGTVVSKGVSSARYFDFWLYGQNGFTWEKEGKAPGYSKEIKATNRPAHYTVLYDEWNLSADQIEEMTYRLCFLNARCRHPISLPTPVYYAHLRCEKAKEMYKDALENDAKLGRLRRDTSSNREQLLKMYIEDILKVENHPGMHFV